MRKVLAILALTIPVAALAADPDELTGPPDRASARSANDEARPLRSGRLESDLGRTQPSFEVETAPSSQASDERTVVQRRSRPVERDGGATRTRPSWNEVPRWRDLPSHGEVGRPSRGVRIVRPESGPGGKPLVEPRRPPPRVMDPDRPTRRLSRTPLPGADPLPPATISDHRAVPVRRWSRDWRHDRRFDWRDHRRRHRSQFSLGFYLDPFGWSYHRHGIGRRLWPVYYSSRYWLHDPWRYRLPPTYGPYRWVRYHRDALLVNIYSGQVVDVLYDVFW